MRKLLLAFALALALEGAAQACSCVAAQSEGQKREWARDMLNRAIAVVEVEPIDVDGKATRGERYRVTRVYAGKAPSTFRVDRSGPESTCADFPGAVKMRSFTPSISSSMISNSPPQNASR